MEAWKIRDRTYAVRVKRRSADLLQLGLETEGAVLRRNAKKQNSIKKKGVDIGAPSHGRGDISLQRKTQRDHEIRRTADLSQRTSLAEADFACRYDTRDLPPIDMGQRGVTPIRSCPKYRLPRSRQLSLLFPASKN
jgi:hypothetical protein